LEIQFEILVHHLHPHLLSAESESVAEFHEELPQIILQSSLKIGFAVSLWEIQEVKKVAVLANA
jgi:hypothetical protein